MFSDLKKKKKIHLQDRVTKRGRGKRQVLRGRDGCRGQPWESGTAPWGPARAAFPGTLTGHWFGTGVPRTQADAQVTR